MSTPVSMDAAKKRLAVIWLTGSGLLFLLLVIQSIRGIYGSETGGAWGWLLPSITPTLSLIIGVLVADFRQANRPYPVIDPFLPRLTSILSVVYLFTVAATILLEPFTPGLTTTELMQMSHFWLAPFQGLVSAAMGAFFVTKNDDKKVSPAETG